MFSRSNFAQFMQSNNLCSLCSLKRNALLSCNTYSLVSTVKNKLLAVRCDVVTEKCSTINRLHLQLFTVYIFAPLRVDSFGVCNLYYFSFSSLHLEYRIYVLVFLFGSQVDDTEVISFLLSTEIIPLCLRTMEMGSELSKTVEFLLIIVF